MQHYMKKKTHDSKNQVGKNSLNEQENAFEIPTRPRESSDQAMTAPRPIDMFLKIF